MSTLHASLSKMFIKTAICLATLQIFSLEQAFSITPSEKRNVSRSELIRGKVTDIYNKPLTDVSVSIKGQDEVKVYTDIDGTFELRATKGDVLVFSLIGFKAKEETVSENKALKITLTSEEIKADSYRTLYIDTKKSLSTGAISEIYTDQLTKNQTPSFGGLLQARIAGLATNQTSGEPGADGVSLSLRGQTPSVWIDGVPQAFLSINPEQIESVTILKDAVSTAMLGIRGSGGLIQITTKKGAEGPQRIAFTALAGIQKPLELPKFLNSYDYARLYNEALANDGKSAIYSQADLNAYKNGTDPIGHPDVDWQNQVLKNSAPYSRYDLSISGGRKIARYYVNLDYLNQGGLLKTEDYNAYNTNSNYKRYFFRTNVDVDLSKSVNAYLNIATRIQTSNDPGAFAQNIFYNFRATPNNAYPVFNSNGSFGGNQDYNDNLYSQAVSSGYRPSYYRDFRVDLGLKGKLDDVLPGLYVKGRLAINAYLVENINRSKTSPVYQETVNSLGNSVFQIYRNQVNQTNGISIDAQNKRFYTEVAAGYSKQFGKNFIEAIVLASNDNFAENSQLASDLKGISGKASYNYDEKYLFDIAFAYNGWQLYSKTNRYGFFPAVGLGWNLAKEDFVKDNLSWVNQFKLRGSFGKTGNNNVGYYEYNKYYTIAGGYSFGETHSAVAGVTEGAMVNPNITWEKALKANIGIDATLFNNKISITADYFNDNYFDLLQTRGYNSQVLGNTYSRVNIGKERYSGFELQISYQDRAGDFNYFISPNLTLSKTKSVFQDEVNRNYSWMQRTGQPVGQAFGYIADGLFQNTQEISNSALPVGINPRPGDIKYRDLNNDGKIDENDITAIGNTKPQFFYGVNLGFNFKGFDFTALIQGVENRVVYLSGNSYWEFQNGGKDQAYEHHLNRWTPETAASATYPRLSIGTNINNQQTSSYWFRPANYLRLKSVELGYSLPTSWIKKVKLSGFRFFVNGYNVFTATSLNDMDPQVYNGSYPIQRVLTAGVNIKL